MLFAALHLVAFWADMLVAAQPLSACLKRPSADSSSDHGLFGNLTTAAQPRLLQVRFLRSVLNCSSKSTAGRTDRRVSTRSILAIRLTAIDINQYPNSWSAYDYPSSAGRYPRAGGHGRTEVAPRHLHSSGLGRSVLAQRPPPGFLFASEEQQ
jgi:hypothetical protein